MSCVLRADGRDFDVDSFLVNSPLKPLIVYHRGRRRFPFSKMTPDDKSGMNVSVSEREFADLTGQISDAIHFLADHFQELKRLREFPGLERLVLDFPVADRDVAVERDCFPAELMSLMGELRIDLHVSHYPRSQNV